MNRIHFDDYKPFVVEETARGWFAGEGGLGARGKTRDEAIAKLRAIQALVRRLIESPTEGAE